MDAVDRQEHDRQGRVPADRRDRAALRAHAGRPVERTRGRQHRGRLGDRVLGGLHARRAWRPSGGGGPSGRPKASRRTSRTWCAARSRWCGTSSRNTGTSKCARCRWRPGHYMMDPADMLQRVDENTIMVVPTLGVTYTGAYEPVAGPGCRPGPAAGRHRPGYRHSRRRGQRRLPRPVLRARPALRLPSPPRQVDQRLGAQVRPGSARCRLGPVARPRGAPRRPDLPRELPRRRHAGLPDQLLPARPARSSPSTTTSSVSAARVTKRIHDASYDIGQYLAGEIVKLGPFELLCDSDPADGDPGGHLADPRRRGSGLHAVRPGRPAARHVAGRCPPTPSPARPPTSPCSASWSARASAGTWRRLLLDDFRDAVGAFRQASGHRADVEGGVQRVQPPLTPPLLPGRDYTSV